MLPQERRYDIDWLRVIAIGLLLIYHIAIAFQPWGVFIGFIQSSESMESIWIPMSMLNVWRIPLLFFVSGMGVCFAIQRRGWKELMMERAKRILVPFIFGSLVIVPLHVWLWSDYYRQDFIYQFNPGHLWFLGNIFIYVLVLSPLFFFLKKRVGGRIQQVISKLFSTPLGLLVMAFPFMVEVLLVQPENFEMYAFTAHGFWLGMIAFLSGFCLVYSGNAAWKTLNDWRWLHFGLALSLYIVRLVAFEMKSYDLLMVLESNFWIFSVLGFGNKYLNIPSKALTYLSQAAYPVYVLHMVFLYLGSLLLFDLSIWVSMKFVLLIVITTIGCYISYEYLVRRLKILRPLFGLK